jgi:hypothetical protein
MRIKGVRTKLGAAAAIGTITGAVVAITSLFIYVSFCAVFKNSARVGVALSGGSVFVEGWAPVDPRYAAVPSLSRNVQRPGLDWAIRRNDLHLDGFEDLEHGPGIVISWATVDAASVGQTRCDILLRLWLPLIALGVIGVWGCAPSLVRYFRPEGTCRACGYDLRASPDRCPECGTPAPKRADPPTGLAQASC